METAKKGTAINSELVCPETGKHFSTSSIRGDRRINGQSSYGLRLWENSDLVPRPDDTFQERLYCIRYIETFYEQNIGNNKIHLSKKEAESLPNFQLLLETGELKLKTCRHFVEPDSNDLKREAKVLSLVKERLIEWQMDGKIPRNILPTNGDKTEEPIRTRGWTHWHHLFNPRQLLWLGLLQEVSAKYNYSKATYVSLILNAARCSNFNSKLCIWDGSPYKSGGWGAFVQTFSNQALNPLYNYGSRSGRAMYETWHNELDYYVVSKNGLVFTSDARSIDRIQDFWITDPPYADAINYHELGDFFIAWYEKHLGELFPEWYTDSKSPLAVKGSGIDFNASMVDCFSNFTYLMPSNGAQVVMFTHQDSAVWADLALILWASGLQVTAAWTIQTETDAAGIKKGNYVQGTACMVLRKQSSSEKGYLADIQADVEFEVRDELKKMMELDDKEDPNFSDTDYQLAAYVAALRVITSYKIIQDIDVRYELMRNRQPGETSEIQKIIDSAVKVSCEYNWVMMVLVNV